MIKTSRIPLMLSRICDSSITWAFLLSTDGELLGSYSSSSESNQKESSLSSSSNEAQVVDPSSVGALIAEIAEDYRRSGKAIAIGSLNSQRSEMSCLIIEMESGVIGIASAGLECNVAAVSRSDVELGMFKSKLLSLAHNVQESLLRIS